MALLCKVCDREIFENESENKNYMTTLRKKNDKCFYTKFTFKNVKLDEFDKILSDYIFHHNKNFGFCFLIVNFK